MPLKQQEPELLIGNRLLPRGVFHHLLDADNRLNRNSWGEMKEADTRLEELLPHFPKGVIDSTLRFVKNGYSVETLPNKLILEELISCYRDYRRSLEYRSAYSKAAAYGGILAGGAGGLAANLLIGGGIELIIGSVTGGIIGGAGLSCGIEALHAKYKRGMAKEWKIIPLHPGEIVIGEMGYGLPYRLHGDYTTGYIIGYVFETHAGGGMIVTPLNKQPVKDETRERSLGNSKVITKLKPAYCTKLEWQEVQALPFGTPVVRLEQDREVYIGFLGKKGGDYYVLYADTNNNIEVGTFSNNSNGRTFLLVPEV